MVFATFGSRGLNHPHPTLSSSLASADDKAQHIFMLRERTVRVGASQEIVSRSQVERMTSLCWIDSHSQIDGMSPLRWSHRPGQQAVVGDA